MDYTKAGLAYGSMNVSSDFFIFILPLPMVWHMKLSCREKIGVSLMFMSGAMYVEPRQETKDTETHSQPRSTCAVATVRYYYVVRDNAADAKYFIWRQ